MLNLSVQKLELKMADQLVDKCEYYLANFSYRQMEKKYSGNKYVDAFLYATVYGCTCLAHYDIDHFSHYHRYIPVIHVHFRQF